MKIKKRNEKKHVMEKWENDTIKVNGVYTNGIKYVIENIQEK